MEREMGRKLLELQDAVWNDEGFRQLSEEHEVRNRQFLSTVEGLSPEQQETIWDYIGLLVEIHHKMLEYALK